MFYTFFLYTRIHSLTNGTTMLHFANKANLSIVHELFFHVTLILETTLQTT